MKSLRITLGIAAIAIGSFAAFSFAPASEVKVDDTGIFYRNPTDGSMGDEYDPANHPCQGPSQDVCAQEYNLDTELPTGNVIYRGVKQ